MGSEKNIMPFEDNIARLKTAVRTMIAERKQISDSFVQPSPIWAEFLDVLSYVMDLSADSLKRIRIHTDFFSGNPAAGVLSSWDETKFDSDKLWRRYAANTEGVPAEYCVSEPPFPMPGREAGVVINGKILNIHIVRMQDCISDMYKAGLLDILTQEDHNLILEIGGGYGGLAQALMNMPRIADKSSYIIVDFPEMFMFSGAFLSLHFPDKKFYIYDPETFDQLIETNGFSDYDFLLLPNYCFEKLSKLKEITLAINMISFQEMESEQVDIYARTLATLSKYGLYSSNTESHRCNTDIVPVSEALSKYFKLEPSKQMYDDAFADRTEITADMYRSFVAMPKDRSYHVGGSFIEKHRKRVAPKS